MKKIQETNNYSKFLINDFNRDVVNTKVLETSMEKYGWIDAYPMHVVEECGNYVIKAGHHRFEVAKKLGISVKYIVCENDFITITELEGSTTQWSLKDYMISYARMFISDYEHLKRYYEKTTFPLSVCISLCAGESARSGNYIDKFKNGTYKLGDQSHADQLWDIARFLRGLGLKLSSNSQFIKAMSKCIRVESFDVDLFKKRSKTHLLTYENQPNIEKYIEMIEHIYNKGGRHNTIPLVYLANEEAKRRSCINY